MYIPTWGNDPCLTNVGLKPPKGSRFRDGNYSFTKKNMRPCQKNDELFATHQIPVKNNTIEMKRRDVLGSVIYIEMDSSGFFCGAHFQEACRRR